MVEKLIEEGIEFCKKGDFGKGVASFNKALEKEPMSIPALYNRARAWSRLGQLESSKRLRKTNAIPTIES